MTRRELFRRSAILSLFGSGLAHELIAGSGARLQISACDWSLGKNADLSAFDVAGKIGLDGVQVNMGSAADDLKLRNPELQKLYLEKSKAT